MTPIALMLYTVRRAAADDLETTLRDVAAMGFDGVELHDLYGHEPAQVGAWLRELGLTACGRHARLEAVEGQLDALSAEAEALGWRRLAISWVDPAELGEPTLVRIATAAGALAARGLQLGYHNHDAEVRQGFLDRLPPGVFLELDAGWAWYAGAEPVELLGRGPLIHIKDLRDRGTPAHCPVGDGAVGYERIVPAAEAAGVEWLIVEQDETEGSELEAAARSLAAVRRFLGPDPAA